jgi:hypothetical protein
MNTFPTQAAALAQAADQREGDVLLRFVDEGVRTYQWVTSLDVEEMISYGNDDFVIVIDNTTLVYSASSENIPAFVDSSKFDDRDNG